MWLIRRLAAPAVAIAIASGAAGCTASSEEVAPDRLRLFFPTGAVVSPDGTKLFVANANSDLTFSSGAISVVPLAAIDQVIERWTTLREVPPELCDDDADEGDEQDHACCSRDGDFTETLVCDEELFLGELSAAGVRIGNFATDIALQDLGNGDLRLIVPTRGDPSIAWADWRASESRLVCDDEHPDDPFPSCDDNHRLSFLQNSADLEAVPEEPFSVFVDSASQFAMVTHLTTGAVTLIDSPRSPVLVRDAAVPGSSPQEVFLPVQVTDIQKNVFQPDPTSGLRGATSVAGRTPRDPGDIVYVGSRSEDRIQTFTVGRLLGLPTQPGEVIELPGGAQEYEQSYKDPFLLTGDFFFLDAVGNNNSSPNTSASDTRGMAFSSSGDRLYLLNRRPPTLQILDTSIGPTGVPNNEVIGAVDICRQASTVTVVGSGDAERAYLTCFQDGQIFAIDPHGRGRVEDIITVGRGPYAVTAAPNGQRLYVTNFLEDTIAVIDLTPGSPTRHRVVLRIGEPRPL
jgi:DNA-binding beta-propeller fold protein YncE